MIKINILPRMLFLFQTTLTDVAFKQWQKDISKFVSQGKKTRIKYQVLQDTKERRGLGLSNLKLYFAAWFFL